MCLEEHHRKEYVALYLIDTRRRKERNKRRGIESDGRENKRTGSHRPFIKLSNGRNRGEQTAYETSEEGSKLLMRR